MTATSLHLFLIRRLRCQQPALPECFLYCKPLEVPERVLSKRIVSPVLLLLLLLFETWVHHQFVLRYTPLIIPKELWPVQYFLALSNAHSCLNRHPFSDRRMRQLNHLRLVSHVLHRPCLMLKVNTLVHHSIVIVKSTIQFFEFRVRS